MSAIVLAPEAAQHDAQIEHIHEEAFGPGRFARAAFRVREGGPHDADLSFVALDGDDVIASVRLTPVRIGKASAQLLGPLAVRPDWKNKGHGRALVKLALDAAQRKGVGFVLLVGDQPYYGPLGFARVPRGQILMPGPVDLDRVLAAELTPGSVAGAAGVVRWGR